MYQLGLDPAVDVAPGDVTTLQQLADQQAALLREFRASEARRKLSTLFALGGAVFAAFRLGILAFPTLRAKATDWRARRLGTLAPNPGRRRRRRLRRPR